MTSDGDLRAALGGSTAFDPAFRVAVLRRICARAQRRAAMQQAMSLSAGGVALGLVAQALTPAGTGVPGLEAVSMAASLGAAAVLLATLVVIGPGGTARWLQQTFAGASRYLPS